MSAPKKKKSTRAKDLARALAADDALIAESAGRGKPLPKWQRQKIEAELGMLPTGTDTDSIRELIQIIGISHPSFIKLRKMRGHPGDHEGKTGGRFIVDAWRVFAKKNLGPQAKFIPNPNLPGVGKIQPTEDGQPLLAIGDEQEQLKLQKLRDELADSRKDRAIKDGLYLLKTDVEEAIRACNEKWKQELSRVFIQAAPAEYAQHSGDETICREINRRKVTEVLTHLHSGDWKA